MLSPNVKSTSVPFAPIREKLREAIERYKENHPERLSQLISFRKVLDTVTTQEFFNISDIDKSFKQQGYKNMPCGDLTWLNLAVLLESKELVQDMLKYGARIDARDSKGYTALHYVAKTNNVKIAEVLVDARADINDGPYGFTPLHMAAKKGNIEVAKYLIGELADIEAKMWSCKKVPLMLQVYYEKLPNKIKTYSNKTPLYYAVIKGKTEMVKYLAEAGADVKLKQKEDGKTFLHYAAEAGNAEIAKLLLDHGAAINKKDYKWNTPLHTAVTLNNIEMVKILVLKGADLNILGGQRGLSPKDLARKKGYSEIAEYLSNPKAEKWVQDAMKAEQQTEGFFLVSKADALEDRTEINKLLAKYLTGVDKNYSDAENIVMNSKMGIFLSGQGDYGNTKLHYAVGVGSAALVESLINSGVNIEAKNNAGSTPIYVAARRGDPKILEVLIKHKANINAKNKWGSTPLHYAAEHGQTEAVRLLLENGADVNAQDSVKDTPLHRCSYSGNIETAKILVRCGADPKLKNCIGDTALDGTSIDHPEIAEYLSKLPAEIAVQDVSAEEEPQVASSDHTLQEGQPNSDTRSFIERVGEWLRLTSSEATGEIIPFDSQVGKNNIPAGQEATQEVSHD